MNETDTLLKSNLKSNTHGNALCHKGIQVYNGKHDPQACDLVKLCEEIIGRSAQDLSTKGASEEYYLMNRHQCEFLVKRLCETQNTLAYLQQSPLLDEKTIPVLQELHKVLVNSETLIQSSYISTSQLLRAAIEQGDMKETFSKLLYDVQWHTSVLQSILVDNSRESRATFEPALCYGLLNVGDELGLLTAMKEDEEALKDNLMRSVTQLEDSAEQELANQMLKNLKVIEDELSLVVEDSNDVTLVISSFDLLFLNPQSLRNRLRGTLLGKGSFGQVREVNLLGGTYAIKIFEDHNTHSFDPEVAALKGLGHHPHIVRLLCYSRDSAKCFLIMEKMDMDLDEFLQLRKDNSKLLEIEAVDLMLQIAEGVRYVHNKRMAHRDLKPGNILINLADSKSASPKVSSVKIADFGLTKTKYVSQTYSNQTANIGTNRWMAPEVIQFAGEGDLEKPKFNPQKADVYSFAIICSEVLTGEVSFGELRPNEFKKNVKAGEGPMSRPKLPEGSCSPRLASLIRSCWATNFRVRPDFPEICQELRYIKGLLLRDEQEKLQTQDVVLGYKSNKERTQYQDPWGRNIGDEEGGKISRVTAFMAQIMRQGPWGRSDRPDDTFSHLAASIKSIKLKYQQTPPGVGLLEVEYVEPDGKEFKERYCADIIGNTYHTINFSPDEYVKRVSGSVAPHEVTVGDGTMGLSCVVSLTIHTNLTSYGPFGDEMGDRFTSSTGKVIGFYGTAGVLIDKLGVWIIPDGQDDGN